MKKTLLSLLTVMAASSTAMAGWTDYKRVNPDPAQTVTRLSALSEVLIKWNTGFSFEVSPEAKATITDQTTGQTISSTSIALNQLSLQYENLYAINITFDELTQNGTYTLTVAPGSLVSETDGPNPPLEFTYTVNDPSASTVELPELELVSITPPAGSSFLSIGSPEGRDYIIDTNLNDKIGYATAKWYDVTDGAEEYIGQAYAHHTDEASGAILDGPIVITKKNSEDIYQMYEGHTYEMRIQCFDQYQKPNKELGQLTVQYGGLTKDYVYAEQQFIGITPDPDTFVITSKEDAHFTVSFDGSVEIDRYDSVISLAQAGSARYESITPNADKTQWTFVIPESVLKEYGEIACSVAATDSEGRRVAASYDMDWWARYEGDEYICQFPYRNELILVPLNIDPAEGTVAELKSFTVTTDLGLEMQTYTGAVKLLKGEETIYTFNMDNDVSHVEGDKSKLVLEMPDAVTAPGEYTLFIPKRAFIVNDWKQSDFKFTRETKVNYIIEDKPVPPAVYDLVAKVSPDAGEQNALKDFTITFDEEVSLVLNKAVILDADGKEAASAEIRGNDAKPGVYSVSLADSIIKDGVYTLSVPQGSFGDELFVSSEGLNGRGSSEIKVEYTVKDTSLTGVGSEAGRSDVYNVCGVLVLRDATVRDIQKLDKGIYIVNGKKIVVK